MFDLYSLQALVTARQRSERHLQNVLHSTCGIIFLGTPHHGAGLAKWAEALARSIGLLKQTNPQILGVLESDSEVLARIQDSFHTMIRSRNNDGLRSIDITCFYEELPLPGVGTVGGAFFLMSSHVLTRYSGRFFSIGYSARVYSDRDTE